jgi:hypothetical protein
MLLSPNSSSLLSIGLYGLDFRRTRACLVAFAAARRAGRDGWGAGLADARERMQRAEDRIEPAPAAVADMVPAKRDRGLDMLACLVWLPVEI